VCQCALGKEIIFRKTTPGFAVKSFLFAKTFYEEQIRTFYVSIWNLRSYENKLMVTGTTLFYSLHHGYFIV
jgi:hypothetical protein